MPALTLNKPVTREMAVARAVSDEQRENRTAEFVISTEAVDTYGTVFEVAGWDLERYNRNPIVCYAHKSYGDDPDTIIGTSEVFRDGNQLIGRVTFEPADINPLAEKVYRKVQNGTIRMASIGANPKAYRMGDVSRGESKDVIYFTESELLEWSIVPLGSNPDALKRSVENLEAIRAEIKKDDAGTPPVPTIKRSVRERELSLIKYQ